MMNRKIFLLGMVCALVSLGLTFPWQKKEEEENSALVFRKPAQVQTWQQERAEEKPEVIREEKSEEGPVVVPVDQSDEEEAKRIADVQQQIQRMIWLNRSLNRSYGQQAEMVRKIQDQARIHQKILRNLEAARRTRVPAQNVAQQTDRVVRQEKVRLIQNITQNNYRYLTGTQTSPSSETRT